jgi:hypothetical protein
MNRNLQKIYENMTTRERQKEVVKENNNFSKFDLQDYTEVVYEGKSGHGDKGSVKELLKSAIDQGLVTIKETKSGWLVKSTKTPHQETIHTGERAYHYLRRFLQKISN